MQPHEVHLKCLATYVHVHVHVSYPMQPFEVHLKCLATYVYVPWSLLGTLEANGTRLHSEATLPGNPSLLSSSRRRPGWKTSAKS